MSTVAKWGNSLAVRVPRKLADAASLHRGSVVELSVVEGALMVRPARPRYRLEDLLRGMTPRKRHREVSWGKPKGGEAR